MSENISLWDEKVKENHELKRKIQHLETHIETLEHNIEKKKHVEKKYYDFFNYIPMPVLIIDIDTFVNVDCNLEFEKFYNISKEDVFIKYSPNDFLPDLSIFKNIKKYSNIKNYSYVHSINNQQHFVDLNITYINTDRSNFLLILIYPKEKSE